VGPAVDELTDRICPACRTADLDSPLVVKTNPTAEALSFEELKPHWRGFFKDKVFFSYYRCPHCLLLYSKKYFSPGQLSVLYGQMPDNTAGVPLNALKKTQDGYFRQLRKYSPLTGAFLELGPDIGLFTEACVKNGRFDSYWMIEPNREVYPALEQRLRGTKYAIYPDFEKLDSVPDGKISAVAMVHVLDHILDPVGYLRELRKKLTSDAVLLFVTHDESSLLARVIRQRWPAYCLQHPHLFNPDSMGNLLKSAGYNKAAVVKSVNYFPVMYLAKHFLWAMGFKKINLPQLSWLSFPFKLGNIVTIAKPSN
jgi:hypothetical protein